jgi:hypothetical protein
MNISRTVWREKLRCLKTLWWFFFPLSRKLCLYRFLFSVRLHSERKCRGALKRIAEHCAITSVIGFRNKWMKKLHTQIVSKHKIYISSNKSIVLLTRWIRNWTLWIFIRLAWITSTMFLILLTCTQTLGRCIFCYWLCCCCRWCCCCLSNIHRK